MNANPVQEMVTETNPAAAILPHVLGASGSGVITAAILAGVCVAVLR